MITDYEKEKMKEEILNQVRDLVRSELALLEEERLAKAPKFFGRKTEVMDNG